MRIATLATGGIGGFLAVHLGRAGHEVACIARGTHLDAIRCDGLQLDGPDGRLSHRPQIATDDPADVGPVDAVIFGVKGGGLEDAARACLPMLGPETLIVPFLNGVEAAERLAAIIPAAAVGNGVAYVSTTIAAPGVIGQTGTFARFEFGERDNRSSARVGALRAALRAAGIDAPDVDDIDAAVWRKFVLFSALSGVTAAARCRIGTVRDTPDLAALFRRVMDETKALAHARGIGLPGDLAARHWAFVETMPPETRASTAVDLEKGAALESPWVSGAVARLASESGLDAPANAALAAVLAPYAAGADAQS